MPESTSKAAHLAEHQFRPGQSGNPNGRPRGLERRVRDLLGDDIDAMTLAMRDVALGIQPKEGPLAGTKITTRDRVEAYKVLTDRGWGKPRQIVDVREPGVAARDLSKLSLDELDQLIRDAEDAADDDPPPPAPG